MQGQKLPWILNFTLIKWSLIITAMINGLGAGILWVGQGKFISECANDSNKGLFNSIFVSVYMSSQVWGSAIAGIILKNDIK